MNINKSENSEERGAHTGSCLGREWTGVLPGPACSIRRDAKWISPTHWC